MLRQSVFGRLAGYEGVNDAERLRHDPAKANILTPRCMLRNFLVVDLRHLAYIEG
jgi:hypothetical protein